MQEYNGKLRIITNIRELILMNNNDYPKWFVVIINLLYFYPLRIAFSYIAMIINWIIVGEISYSEVKEDMPEVFNSIREWDKSLN